MLEGFTLFVIGLASLLSGIVRMLIIAQHKQIVMAHRARAVELCVLAGISSPHDLQDVFGPPTLDGVWSSVTREEIRAKMKPLGHVVGRQWPNYAAVALAVIAPFLGIKLINLTILIVFCIQVLGWSFTGRLSSGA